ncbi:MAG: glycosyltransferase family 4 protein, partial [Planctomycetes bacterium]|nr:glycosyltransferase family 4 protein [Planctomycetota bacterium]
RRLKESFGVESTVIPMPCPGPAEADYRPKALPDGAAPHVLWVGRIVELKRLEWLLDVAETCSELAFDVVGPSDATDYVRGVLGRAEGLANVTVHGEIARDELLALYRSAAVLCNTSIMEGFPNTYLEAWSHGLPVVATFDPDGLIASKGLGAVARDPAGLAAALREILGSDETYRRLSQAAREHYLRNYTVEAVMPRYEQLFRQVLERP